MKKVMTYFAGVALAGAAVFCLVRGIFSSPKAEAGTGTVVSSFQLGLGERTGRNPQGLGYDGEYLWLMDACSMKNAPYIYQITTGGSIASSFPQPVFYPVEFENSAKGLGWDGSRLRLAVSGQNQGRIYRINPANPNPNDWKTLEDSTLPFGVDWGGGNIWTVDNRTGVVYRVNPANGSTVNSFTTATEMGTRRKAAGLAYETGANRIWVSGFGRVDRIYGYTTSGSFVDSFDAPSTHPMGMAWDGTYLWYVDGCTDYFYQIEYEEE